MCVLTDVVVLEVDDPDVGQHLDAVARQVVDPVVPEEQHPNRRDGRLKHTSKTRALSDAEIGDGGRHQR